MSMQITTTGEKIITKKVGNHPTAGVVYVPKEWVGRSVIVILEEKNTSKGE